MNRVFKVLCHGQFWNGSTTSQRFEAFSAIEGVQAIPLDCGARMERKAALWHRVRWKLRWPVDTHKENLRLLEVCRLEKPTCVIVDNSKVISKGTLISLRGLGVQVLVYYSPDDIVARHNLSLPLKRSLPLWDLVFTTKTFNIQELQLLGVRQPCLIGKSFDPTLHCPLPGLTSPDEHEAFDAVFVGTYEVERCRSINALAEAGTSVVVYGRDLGGWKASQLHERIELRPSVFGEDYRQAWHTGKVALCFLRKLNRDKITQRTMEIAAMARPMVAEKTAEHDEHFQDGTEYFGFTNNHELVHSVNRLLADPSLRKSVGRAARERCHRSGYSTHDRAREMISLIQDNLRKRKT